MEALGALKFWKSAGAGGGADSRSDVGDARDAAYVTEDEETDNDDELFDLVFSSPNFRDAIVEGGFEGSRKLLEIVDSPRDVLLGGINFSNSKPASPPVTVLRPAQKFKVKFVLGFGKSSSKCDATDGEAPKATPLRKSSSRSSSASFGFSDFDAPPAAAREKLVPKYLKLIKPFYIKASKKVKLTASTDSVTAETAAPPKNFSEGNRSGSFTMVPRNLRKSRSASAAAIHRKDDSLVEQHDGIQSAILHCKKSYSSSSEEFSQLFRRENSKAGERNSCDGDDRCSI